MSETAIHTPDGPAPERRPLSYDDYLRLLGLLQLGADHAEEIRAIERSACRLLGINEAYHNEIGEAIWGSETAGQLLRRLEITVAKETP